MYAAVTRTSRSKGVQNTPEVNKFVDWAKKRMRSWLKPVGFDLNDIFQRAADYVTNTNKSRAVKQKYLNGILDLFDKRGVRATTLTCHTKSEVLPAGGLPRKIDPREDTLRNLSAVIYEAVMDQVYQHPMMIKNMAPDQVSKKILEATSKYGYTLSTDISSYDAAQQGRINEIEEEAIRIITGEQATQLWKAIVHNIGDTRSGKGDFRMLYTCCRGSGEMSTALTNALLHVLIVEYATQGRVCSSVIEGDDGCHSMPDPQTADVIV